MIETKEKVEFDTNFRKNCFDRKQIELRLYEKDSQNITIIYFSDISISVISIVFHNDRVMCKL